MLISLIFNAFNCLLDIKHNFNILFLTALSFLTIIAVLIRGRRVLCIMADVMYNGGSITTFILCIIRPYCNFIKTILYLYHNSIILLYKILTLYYNIIIIWWYYFLCIKRSFIMILYIIIYNCRTAPKSTPSNLKQAGSRSAPAQA